MITQKVDVDDDVLGFTHTWVNRLAGRVGHLYVLALAVGRRELRDNVTLFSMGKEGGAGRLRRWVNFNRVVASLVLGRRVDGVFVHMVPLYAVLAAPWARLAGAPMALWYTHRCVSWRLRLAHCLVDCVVTASPEGFRLRSDKVVVTGHGVDTDVFRPVGGPRPGRPFTVLSVGRVSPIKGYETLVEAVDILVNQRRRCDLRWVVVGGAGTPAQVGYREWLEAEAERRGLGGYLEFVGGRPHGEVVGYYQGADLFVSLSRTDSLDKAVLEAMACGVAPLTCNVAFGPLLGALGPGLMFAAQDARGLADGVERLARLSEVERVRLGVELRAIVVERHSVGGLMDRLVRVWDRGGR